MYTRVLSCVLTEIHYSYGNSSFFHIFPCDTCCLSQEQPTQCTTLFNNILV